YPVDLALSGDGHYLYVSYQGLPVQLTPPTFNPDGSVNDPGTRGEGGVLVFDAKAMLQEVDKELKNPAFPNGSLPRKIAIDDLPLDASSKLQFNPVIDVKADYRLH